MKQDIIEFLNQQMKMPDDFSGIKNDPLSFRESYDHYCQFMQTQTAFAYVSMLFKQAFGPDAVRYSSVKSMINTTSKKRKK